MSRIGLIALAVVLFFSVVLSVYNALVAIVWAARERSWLVASRAAYPLAVAAACGFMLDHIQFKLTGVNGIADLLVVSIGIFVFCAAVIRTLAIVIHKDSR